jgi:HAD superfamily hydrolase (TIGR01509 family)
MSTSPRWGRTTKQLVSATLLIVAGLLLYSFRTILPQLIVVFLLAYVFAPVVGWLSKRMHVARGVAVLLLYLVGLGVLAAASAIAVPPIVNETQDLIRNLDDIINSLIAWLEQFDRIEFLGYVLPLPEIELPTFSLDFDRVTELVRGTITPIAGGAFSVVYAVASGVGWVLFTAMTLFYLLVDADRLGPGLQKALPPPYRTEFTKLGARINRTWNAFLRGQIVLSVIMGVITSVAMSSIGIRFAIALGVVAGILEIIPHVGPTLASIPAILIALFQGSSYLPLSNLAVAIIVAGTYVVLQSIENNLLVPRIIGSSLNLHPLVVIIGVLAGGTLGGILGALLAAPVLATLRTVIQYIYRKLVDLEPFPAPASFADVVQERDVRAILFDLDGTLIDTDDMLVERLARRLRPRAFVDRLYDNQRLARRIVMAAESPMNAIVTVLDLFGLDDRFFALGEWFRRASGQRKPAEYAAVDGAIGSIRALSERYDLAIVTTRNRSDLLAFILEFDLQDCFKATITRQDVKRLKPHPEPVRHAAERLGYSPEQCIIVGDTTVDVKAGKKAGALTVSVLCGFGERPELERLEPDLVLETTAQLVEYLPHEEETRVRGW